MSNTEQLDTAVVALLLVAADNEEAPPREPPRSSCRAQNRSCVPARALAPDGCGIRDGRSYRESKGW